MSFREAKAKLPTQDETRELYSRFDQALEFLEHRVYELRKLEEVVPEPHAPRPSFDDLGRLSVLIENLEGHHNVLGGRIKHLKGILDQLYALKDKFERRSPDA